MSIPFLNKVARAAVKLSSLGLSKGPHITRYSMYEQLSSCLPHRTGRVLAISGSSRLASVVLDLEQCELVEADYPEYDVLDLPFADGRFDFVVSDQVLEHVEGSPERAFDELHRVVKPGGWVVTTTCFMLPIHRVPDDFWRFSPHGLRYLCRRFSAVSTGSWGNPGFFPVLWLGLWLEPVPHARWHPFNWLARWNSPPWAVSTWAVAQK